MPYVKIKKSMNYYPDGTTMTHVEQGDVAEMSVKWAEIFEREDWGFITHKSPKMEEESDGDDSSDESGSGEDDPGSDPIDGSEAEEGSGDPGGDEGDGGTGDDDGPAATPRAVEVAEELSIDLGGVVGTGGAGVITVGDVRSAAG